MEHSASVQCDAEALGPHYRKDQNYRPNKDASANALILIWGSERAYINYEAAIWKL